MTEVEDLPPSDQLDGTEGRVEDRPEEAQPEVADGAADKDNDGWDDILGSGGLMRKIINPGSPDYRPQKLNICHIKYELQLLDGTVVEMDSNFKLQLGDLEVVQGLDLALALMNIGERCLLRIEPRLAYGSVGLPPKIPPNTTVIFDVELLSVDFEDPIFLSIPERKQIGNAKKTRGNWWYSRQEMALAAICYKRALEYLDEVEPAMMGDQGQEVDDEALQDLLKDRMCVTNNLAAAQMHLGAHDIALQSLELVLRCQPRNIKALYRKATIMKERNDLDCALKCLQLILKEEPNNTAIQKKIQGINAILRSHHNKEREMAKKMLNATKPQPASAKAASRRNGSKILFWASVASGVAAAVIGVAAYQLYN